MDSQVSLVVNAGNDERWYLYRDLTTQSMRSAGPYYVDTSPPPAVTDFGFVGGTIGEASDGKCLSRWARVSKL
jgi:hypothetical protein